MRIAIAAATLLIAAAGSAQAAPIYSPSGWYQGRWTCSVAHAPKIKLFVTLGPRIARAAVREYPYYGKTEYKTLIRSGVPVTSVSYRGSGSFLTLKRSSRNVLTGSGRIGTTLMLLTCSRG